TQVPDGLGLRVQRVEEVARQVAVAAAAADAARAVEGEDRDRDVESELAVQPAGAEAGEVHPRLTHAVARHAHDPRARRPIVSQDPGVGGAVWPIAEPARPSGDPGVWLEAAREREVPVTAPPAARIALAGQRERRRRAMEGLRPRQPAAL